MDRYWLWWVLSWTTSLVWCRETSLLSHLVQYSMVVALPYARNSTSR